MSERNLRASVNEVQRRQWIINDLIAAGYADPDGTMSFDAVQESSGYTPEDFRMYVTDPLTGQIDANAFDDAIADAMDELEAPTAAELIWKHYINVGAAGGGSNPLYQHVIKTCEANGFSSNGHLTALGSTLLAGIASKTCADGDSNQVARKRLVLSTGAPNDVIALYMLARDRGLINERLTVSKPVQRMRQRP